MTSPDGALPYPLVVPECGVRGHGSRQPPLKVLRQCRPASVPQVPQVGRWIVVIGGAAPKRALHRVRRCPGTASETRPPLGEQATRFHAEVGTLVQEVGDQAIQAIRLAIDGVPQADAVGSGDHHVRIGQAARRGADRRRGVAADQDEKLPEAKLESVGVLEGRQRARAFDELGRGRELDPAAAIHIGRELIERLEILAAGEIAAQGDRPGIVRWRGRKPDEMILFAVELLHFLGHENVIELKLGDQIQREMTILFVDIRAFTNLSEGMTPQENFKFINSYLARITPIIRENNGFIDKYIGDAILALYPGSPEDALRSAIRMVDYLQEYNGYRRNSGYRPINIGIGIHTGNLIVGIIGDADRMQGTVISDAVNLASRVQDVTKLYGANIIISQDTFVRLENPTAYNFRFLGKVKVKGKNQSVSLFEVFDGESPERVALKSRTKQGFEDAILLFSQRKFAEATEAFRRIAAQNPNDRAALLFLNRAELFLKREKANWLLQ